MSSRQGRQHLQSIPCRHVQFAEAPQEPQDPALVLRQYVAQQTCSPMSVALAAGDIDRAVVGEGVGAVAATGHKLLPARGCLISIRCRFNRGEFMHDLAVGISERATRVSVVPVEIS